MTHLFKLWDLICTFLATARCGVWPEPLFSLVVAGERCSACCWSFPFLTLSAEFRSREKRGIRGSAYPQGSWVIWKSGFPDRPHTESSHAPLPKRGRTVLLHPLAPLLHVPSPREHFKMVMKAYGDCRAGIPECFLALVSRGSQDS